MKPLIRSFLFFLWLLVLGLVAGCAGIPDFAGNGRLIANLLKPGWPNSRRRSRAKGLGAMQKQLGVMLIPTLIEKLDGASLTITSKEIRFVVKDGTGQSQPYKVVERPTSDTWRVQTSRRKSGKPIRGRVIGLPSKLRRHPHEGLFQAGGLKRDRPGQRSTR